MTIKTLEELAQHIEAIPGYEENKDRVGFDMRYDSPFKHSHKACGTACCIGGHAAVLTNRRDEGILTVMYDLAPDVDMREIDALCYPSRDHRLTLEQETLAWKATPKQAARAIRTLIETGKTDWCRAVEEGL